MPYPAAAVANYFVKKGLRAGRPVEPMKLQKLIYFAHGWHLAIHGEPLIDERIEAWRYGPVVPSIYHAVKHHGARPIDFPIIDFDGEDYVTPMIDGGDVKALLDKIWSVYGGYSSGELSRMSHDTDGPWFRTWKEEAQEGAIRGVDISDFEIKRYFTRVATENRGE